MVDLEVARDNTNKRLVRKSMCASIPTIEPKPTVSIFSKTGSPLPASAIPFNNLPEKSIHPAFSFIHTAPASLVNPLAGFPTRLQPVASITDSASDA
jgi:hypothetical protein